MTGVRAVHPKTALGGELAPKLLKPSFAFVSHTGLAGERVNQCIDDSYPGS
ncbi:MAG: hypothetical protein ABSC94_22085 [Polyangiaceae bacterium]|jgi:hypothetical protein